MPPRVDLHAHTAASDGALSPEELARAACERGIAVLAVTDHDTIAGVLPAMAAAGDSLRVLPGVELSGLHEGQSVHLLGYGIDPGSRALVSRLRGLSLGREERAQAIVEMLGEMGAPIAWERVVAFGKGAIARPHIARALVEAGHARDVADAFARYIGEGCPAYLPSGRLSVAEAVDVVHQAGGQTAIAHPFGSHPKLDLQALLPALLAAGLTGVEAYHSEHDAGASARARQIAAEHGLWWSGGSDFHGPSKPDVQLGGVDVPPEVLDQGPFPAALAAQHAAGL